MKKLRFKNNVIKIWLINHKKRKTIKLIIKNHIHSPQNKLRGKELENAIFNSVKIVTDNITKSEKIKQEQHDKQLLISIQKTIKKYYADKDNKYADKDKQIENLRIKLKRKTEKLETIQQSVC